MMPCTHCRIDDKNQVKVADFGLSHQLFEREYYRSKDHKAKLPIKWMALESLEDFVFTAKSDVVCSLTLIICAYVSLNEIFVVDLLSQYFCGQYTLNQVSQKSTSGNPHGLFIHSFISSMRHYERIMPNVEWAILSHVSCFVQGEFH